MNTNWILIAYYTIGNISYEEHAKRLNKSIGKFNVRSYIKRVGSLGTWIKNTQYKPHFIREALDMFRCPVVYTDADSELLQYPILFDSLICNVGAYELNHAQFRRKSKPPELLSGTLFFDNTVRARQIIDLWIKTISMFGDIWDQQALAKVINQDFYHLPPQYCTIKGYMDDVKDPIIIHHQASREHRGGPNYK
jgi:hypothetical protein